MTDRELLELAAKAAGWIGWRSKHGYWNINDPDGTAQTCCTNWPIYSASTGDKLLEPTFADALSEAGWNPLDDDGDALRLAVKLGIGAQSYAALGYSHAGAESVMGSVVIKEPHNGTDPHAATRRAIVRAAAAIGASA
jgi:hypothetical protein